jgi:hypothetical protein
MAGRLLILGARVRGGLPGRAIVNIRAAGVFAVDEWLSYAAIGGVSLLYGSAFFTSASRLPRSRSGAASRSSRRSSFWVVFVLVIPNTSSTWRRT